MKSRRQIHIAHLLAISLILFAGRAVAQKPSDSQLQDAAYQCLASKFMKIWRGAVTVPDQPRTTLQRDPSDPNRAFDPESGRNFAWDATKKEWIDVKTGESMTPKSREDAMYCCLASKFVEIWKGAVTVPDQVRTTLQRDLSDHTRAFDPASGRNFVWDKDKGAWIDAKTGECVCPQCSPPTETVPPKETPPTPDKVGYHENQTEVFIGYAYTHAPDESAKNLNGFDASIYYNFTSNVAVGGELSGGFGSDQISPTIDTSLHRFTYLFGPQFSFHPNDKVKVFVHPLFGGVHDSSTFTTGTSSVSSSASAFAMAFGGGVDVSVSKRVAVRVFQADYMPTHFGGAWQNNYQISTGVVIHFGEKK